MTNITKLPDGHYFVFGSNEAGRHGKGAALCAKQYFGAVYGQGRCNKKWRQKNQEACFSMQILCSVEKHVRKML